MTGVDVMREQDQDKLDEELFGDGDAEKATAGKAALAHPRGAVPPRSALVDADELGEGEGAPCRHQPHPGDPTPAQRAAHRAEGHIPFRSWCRHCVEGRATGEQHRQRTGTRAVCVFGFDYCFYGPGCRVFTREEAETSAEEMMKVLVVRDSRGKALFGHVVPQKGVDQDQYAVDLLIEDLKWLGWMRVSLRSDNEPAIIKLLRVTLQEMRIEIVPLDQALEEHPVSYDSRANGEIEAAVKQLSGVLRSNYNDLERLIGKHVPLSHPVMSWLVEYSAWMVTVRVPGPDGQTAHERVRGRPFTKRLIGFAEKVMTQLPTKGPEREERADLAARWVDAIVLGYGNTSFTYWVFDGESVAQRRSIQRKPTEEQVDAEMVEKLNITRQALHQPKEIRVVPFAERQEEAAPEAEATRRRAARKLELRQHDFDPAMGGHGWTEGCPTCSRARRHGWRNKGSGGHSVRCRARIEAKLAETATGQARLASTQERTDRYLAERVEEADKAACGPEPAGPEATHAAKGEEQSPPSNIDSDGDGDFGEHGMEAPMTPGGIPDDTSMAPTSPGLPEPRDEIMTLAQKRRRQRERLARLRACQDREIAIVEETDRDLQPLMDFCAADGDLTQRVKRDMQEMLNIVHELGGDGRRYRRERGAAAGRMVAEVYSRPRVTAAAAMMPDLEVVPGFALDVSGCDEHGEIWDFTREDMRRKARKLRDEVGPMFLIGSPPCTLFSSWQQMYNARHNLSEEEARRRRAAGEVHLAFVCELYQAQVDDGKYFLHEHPQAASSWNLDCVRAILEQDFVERTVCDQCQYSHEDRDGNPVRKATGWMSNSPEILKQLSRRCRGPLPQCSRRKGGRHSHVSGRLAREAAVYPVELCKAILIGCRNQLRRDGRLTLGVVGLQPDPLKSCSDRALARRIAKLYALDVESQVEDMQHDEHVQEAFRFAATGEEVGPELLAVVQAKFHGGPAANPRAEVYTDSVTGQRLQPDLVRAARRKELEYFYTKGVWTKRRLEEAREKMGKPAISVRWIDTNKGDDECPNYRSRLVAREIRRKGEDPIFAPTPPLESLRTVISFAATDLPGEPKHDRDPTSDNRTQVSFIDIARAYFCAATDPNHPTYVALPPEDPDSGRMCSLLLKHMYGTRKAADGWHCEYAGVLVTELDFEIGDASACVFDHRARHLRCSVHGDDLTTVGPKKQLDWMKQELEKRYELTEAHRLGPGATDDREAKALNRIVRWTSEGLEYEADPRQGEKLLRDLKLDAPDVKTLSTPGVKLTRDQLESEQPLARERSGPFRAVAARANYLASDRPDVQYAAKEVCRWMAAPTDKALDALKRMGRFLAGRRRLVYEYP